MEEEFAWVILPRSKEVQAIEAKMPPGELSNVPLLPQQHQMSGIRRQTALLRAAGKPALFPGEKAFRLYDTYGLPKDFISESARDMGFDFDDAGFEKAMQQQRTKARASWKGGAKAAANPVYAKLAETFRTEPDFYHGTSAKDARIEAIIETPVLGARPSGRVSELKGGQTGEIVLDRTVIYAESGGQTTDTGKLYDNSESQLLAHIMDAYYPVSGLIAHKVLAEETLRVGDRVTVVANADRRARIMRNHTGTHLVNAALRNILGTHVKQSGSLNAPDRLRFDFSHFAHVDAEELLDIEQQVSAPVDVGRQRRGDVDQADACCRSRGKSRSPA